MSTSTRNYKKLLHDYNSKMDMNVMLNSDFLDTFRPTFTITRTDIMDVQLNPVHRVFLIGYAFKMEVGITHGPSHFRQDKLYLVCTRRAILEVGLRYQEDELPNYNGNLYIIWIEVNLID